jgi:hypothetical protein
MPLLRRRPLKSAAMVGDAGQSGSAAPSAPDRVDHAASEANRIDALTKLKALYVTGVLTEEQYDSEHSRLTEGI